MNDTTITNTIKVRDDRIPLVLAQKQVGGDYSLVDKEQPVSWLSANEKNEINNSDLRGGIEPWLTSLFQSEHLSLLMGAGLSIAIEHIATGKPNNAMSKPTLAIDFSEQIENSARIIAKKNNRGEANIEDYVRVINELLRGLKILGYDAADDTNEKKSYDTLNATLENIIQKFAESISEIENSIASASYEKRHEAFDYLVSFLMSFASRIGTRERLCVFTTNYDRLIEAGSEIAGIHLLDRFVGTLAPIFRSSRLEIDMHYNPPGIRGEPRYLEGVARFTKLHGSIDWINTDTDIRRIGLPFGSKNLTNFLNAPGITGADAKQLMIYPNAAKDRETAEYPYVELFRDFAAALCRPNSTLVTYGYGFGDEHINRVIRDMLTIPSTHLVIISYDDVDGRIMKGFEEFGHKTQISLIIGKGVADIKTLVNYFLPKPSIDRASIRMNELLKQRYSEQKPEATTQKGGEPEL